MQDLSKTNQELLEENALLRQRIKELEHSEAEQRRVEEALQESDNRLREITTQVPGVVYQFYVRPTGAMGFYYISDRSEPVLGLKPDLEGYFERFSAIVIPEHRDGFIKSIEKSVKEASEWKYEGMLQKPSGEIIWFSGHSTPSPRENEVVFNGIVQDISDRRRAEGELQLSEERFRLLVKNSSDIMGIVDPDGKQRYVSDAAERITGFPASELASKNMSEVIHPDDLLSVLEAFQSCLAHPDKVLRAEYRHIHKTKDWVYFEAMGQSFINDPSVRGVITNVRDNTERKHAEEALKLSEVTYREIFNTVNDAIWVHDIETGEFLDVNNAVTEMFGYSVSEALNMHVGDISSGVPPFIQETAMELFRKAADGQPQHFEWQCKHKDGHLFWTEVNLKRASIAGKECVLAIERDITDRKQAEEALRESEGRFSLAFNSSPGPMAISEIETGRFLDVNEQTLRLLEFTREEMMGHTSYELGIWNNPEDRTWMITHLHGKGSFREYPVRFITKSRNTLDVLWSAEIITLGRKKVLLSLFSDITERKRAEEALRESEEKYRLIAENTADVISILDMNLRYTYVSPSIMRLRGFTVEEAMKETLDQIFTPESLKIALLAFEEEMKIEAGGTADPDRIRTMELEEYRKDGSIIWVEASLSFLRDRDRKPVGILAVTRGITDRKQAEKEKRSLQERLNHSEKMEALGQLAGGVAHDLNNVLGILSGYSELLLLEIPDGHRSRRHVEKILQSTEKAAAIIQDLLTLARRGVTASDVINLNNVVSGFLKTPVFEKMKDYHPLVTFRTECDQKLLNIKGSPVHLEKTLMNLVSNAAESISGKGEVTIRTESRYLDKVISGYDEVSEGDYAVLTVSDTGMGIPAENREKIFEPFYTKKTMGRSGTGLGLAIVWGTVKDNNGYIDVQTKVGEGTTFTLYFPVTREELIAQQQKAPIERYMGEGESVLVIDDVAEQRDVAARLLTRLGYQVHVVSGGEEALEYLKTHKADLLVLDMIMDPGMDGLETYQRILEINPKQRTIIVSGFSETERVGEAQKLGAGAYVKKPYVMEKIGAAIRKELDKT
jgi:two-component system cell cycle sensor histidine kinase/response regulator CckA